MVCHLTESLNRAILKLCLFWLKLYLIWSKRLHEVNTVSLQTKTKKDRPVRRGARDQPATMIRCYPAFLRAIHVGESCSLVRRWLDTSILRRRFDWLGVLKKRAGCTCSEVTGQTAFSEFFFTCVMVVFGNLRLSWSKVYRKKCCRGQKRRGDTDLPESKISFI